MTPLVKRENINYNASNELTVDVLLKELRDIVRSEKTVNNTWQQVYNILVREGYSV